MFVRRYRETDRQAVLEMGRAFYDATHYVSIAPFDADAINAVVDSIAHSGVLLIAEHDDVAVGMAGLVIAPFHFAPSKRGAYEVMWWVDPAMQGLGAGKMLLAEIEPACRDAGCDFIQMVHLKNSPPQAAALYERLGYEPTESSYTKRIAKWH